MTKRRTTTRLSAVALALVVAGCATQTPPRDAASPPATSTNDAACPLTHERLNGVLWMQTSAEYEALVRTTFRQAARRVEELAKMPRSDLTSAALEQCGLNDKNLKPAVIVDVDETILDNSPMNGALMRSGDEHFKCLWNRWAKQRNATFLEGAADFLKRAEAADVEVFFVTNRDLDAEADTIADLKPFIVKPARFLAVGETDDLPGGDRKEVWTKEKARRRAAIARNWWIVAMVGDDLGDFLPGVREKVTPQQRVQKMRCHLDRFGDRWFLLPNPVYGSWEEAVTAGAAPRDAKLAAKWATLRSMHDDPPCGTAAP